MLASADSNEEVPMSTASVTNLDDIPVHELPGNRLRGLATPGRGSTEIMLWNHRAEAGGASPPHWHDHDQVIYVVSGSGRVVVGEGEHAVRAGDVIVAPANIPHQVHASTNEALDTIVAMLPSLRTYAPDGAEIDQPWKI
jgi:quercetin dioxygenase-like cupin family protein